ncbi:hypothetical protein QE152_g39135 [Popillia japonica]|uniref:Uncharacterized protein n=1 Tax=Popillia japonica TaxID=7064 RepID=A0AAW1HUG8_POPJA
MPVSPSPSCHTFTTFGSDCRIRTSDAQTLISLYDHIAHLRSDIGSDIRLGCKSIVRVYTIISHTYDQISDRTSGSDARASCVLPIIAHLRSDIGSDIRLGCKSIVRPTNRNY